MNLLPDLSESVKKPSDRSLHDRFGGFLDDFPLSGNLTVGTGKHTQ